MKQIVCALTAMILSVGVSAGEPEKQTGFVMPDFKSVLAIADADGDGDITRAEFTQARATFFPKCDADKSGDLSKDEFIKAMTGVVGSEFMAGRVFGGVDSSNDGRLTLEEWNAMPLRAFDNADENKDGRLTPDEIKKVKR